VTEPDPFKPGTGHDQRVRRSSLAATGQTLHLLVVELADARIGRPAKVDHFNLRKQPPHIGRTPHGIGSNFVTLATRALDVFDRNTRPQYQRIGRWIARQRRTDHQPRRILIAGHVL